MKRALSMMTAAVAMVGALASPARLGGEGATLNAQRAADGLDAVAKAMGATAIKSLQYAGSGASFSLGQSRNPDAAWPRSNIANYTALVDFAAPAARHEIVRLQGDPPREQRQIQMVSGRHAWNVAGTNATPAVTAADERALQIWLTPHGFVKAALANNATTTARRNGGRQSTVVSFATQGKKLRGVIDDAGLVEQVETWIAHPLLGDMLIETTYADYKDFNGIKFPTRIVQKQGGFPTLELTITDVQPNAAAAIEVPENVRQAGPPPIRVESQQLAEGLWYITGGSHHSVLVEFKDHVVVIEGPQHEDRSAAVIAEAKRLVPSKPIKYLVNTHHHFDHAGGIRTYAAEGATIVTHRIFKPYYEKIFANAWTIKPDRLAQTKKKATFETVTDKKVLTDGRRTLELHHVQGDTHNDGMIVVYLPREKMLIEADEFTPPAPNTPPPATPSPVAVNLYDNIQRLKLEVAQIVPIHGRVVTLQEFLGAIGKKPAT
jgi:glyoxylase-like metal-dependent hydrolase (beta-lactamase superfamily II)